jgi:hypothetical protein
MREQNHAVQRVIPTPVNTGKDANGDPDMLPISDDDNVDSSLYSQDSESEGGIWDNQDNDNVSIAPERAQLIPPDNDDSNRMPLVGLPFGCTIGQGHEGAYPPPNIVLTATTAPEGATHQCCGKTDSILQPYFDVVLKAN